MSRGTTSKRDPILGSVEDYWSVRSQILRFLARADGPATATEIAEVVGVPVGERNSFAVMLRRLVLYKLVTRTKIDHAAMRAAGIRAGVGAGICAYEYVITPGADLNARRGAQPAERHCTKCGSAGHYRRTCKRQRAKQPAETRRAA